MINVLNKEGMEKHKEYFFTKEGYDCLYNYTQNLVKEYFKRKEYPFKIGIILGLPTFRWAREFKNQDELIGRIKMSMQLLGVDTIKINNLELSFKEENK